jgi:hypothetical protein
MTMYAYWLSRYVCIVYRNWTCVKLRLYYRSNCICIVNEYAMIEKGKLLLTPLPGQK